MRAAVHGATGTDGTIRRVVNPLGEQTGRVGALYRLDRGQGCREDSVRREAPRTWSTLNPTARLRLRCENGK
jgi:hypothetical protein